jgi:hypothetical protein
MKEATEQLENVDTEVLSDPKEDMDEYLYNHARDFASTFDCLTYVMMVHDERQERKRKKEAYLASQGASTSARPGRTLFPNAQTPAPLPLDPPGTSSTDASKDEEYSRQLLSTFLSDTLRVLRKGYKAIEWQQSGLQVQLIHT